MFKRYSSVLITMLCGLLSLLAQADTTRTFNLAPPSGQSGSGTYTITSVPRGPDTMNVQVSNLQPNTAYTVFLTNREITGALPAQILSAVKSLEAASKHLKDAGVSGSGVRKVSAYNLRIFIE